MFCLFFYNTIVSYYCVVIAAFQYWNISCPNFGFSVKQIKKNVTNIKTDIILINIFFLPARVDLSQRGRD